MLKLNDCITRERPCASIPSAMASKVKTLMRENHALGAILVTAITTTWHLSSQKSHLRSDVPSQASQLRSQLRAEVARVDDIICSDVVRAEDRSRKDLADFRGAMKEALASHQVENAEAIPEIKAAVSKGGWWI